MDNGISNGVGDSVVIIDKETGEETRLRFYDVNTLKNTEQLPADVNPLRKEVKYMKTEF